MKKLLSASTTLLAYLCTVFLALPLLAVVPISFTPDSYLSMPTDTLSLRHYSEILTNTRWQHGIWTSLMIGAVVSVVATVLATAFAVGLWYLNSRFTRLLVAAALVPMAVPPVISALTLFFFTTRSELYDTLPAVIVAHTVMAVPYALVTLLVSLSQVDRKLLLASRSLGASVWQTTFLVLLPNIRTGIAASMLLAFVLSWEEISVTLFVTSVEIMTLPKLMWAGLRESIDPIIAAIAVVLIAVSMAGALFATRGRGTAPSGH